MLYPDLGDSSSEPSAPLPRGWAQLVDQTSGAIYFLNSDSGEIRYEDNPPGTATESQNRISVWLDQEWAAPTPSESLSVLDTAIAPPPPGGAPQEVYLPTPKDDSAVIPGAAFARRVAAAVSSASSSATVAIFGASSGPAVAEEITPSERTLVTHRIEQQQVHNDADPALSWFVIASSTTAPRARPAEQFGPYRSQAEAVAAALALVPAVWQADTPSCTRCGQGFGLLKRRTHCRNCGYCCW